MALIAAVQTGYFMFSIGPEAKRLYLPFCCQCFLAGIEKVV